MNSFPPGLLSDEDLLGALAARFRSAREESARQDIAREYADAVDRLIQSGRWIESPAAEDELPDECMPQAFFDYWTQPEPEAVADQEGSLAKWNEIKAAIERNGNVLTVTMRDLVDALGAGALNAFVRAAISEHLAGMGLGHVPLELPVVPREQVRLYKKGTRVGELIDTMLTPGAPNDRKLREQFGG